MYGPLIESWEHNNIIIAILCALSVAIVIFI